MILAAGFGSRLRPLTDRVPKPLVEVGGHPLIAYPLALCRAAGIRDVVINLHHHGDAIRAALGDGHAFGVSIAYSAEDPLLDTGGGILHARSLLGDQRFVVLNSDSIIDLDLRALVAAHVARGAVATMVLRRDREQARFGEIEIDVQQRVRRFLGRPATVAEPLTAYMFAGVHVLEPPVFSHMASGTFGIVRQTYPALLAAECIVSGYVFDGYWRVLDTHAGFAEGRYELTTGANPLHAAHRP
jgi:NDP-sugar pyrophosphorylase family protein